MMNIAEKLYGTEAEELIDMANDQDWIIKNMPEATIADKTLSAYDIKRRVLFDGEKYADKQKTLTELGFNIVVA